ncbi:DUF4283 domain protein, partial [Trifolium medium]|nr:DUF4283 domain protein [Trifolium medium]
AKADWLCYYFKEVKRWSPSKFADRRELWVKVYGIPLHVWGGSLFKAIGEKYGEFLDFDENTASRSKLNVAKLKIAITFRGSIDDSIIIMALGVKYTVWVVEDKGFEPVFYQGSRNEEHQFSWVGSSNFPAEAMEEVGGEHGGSVEDREEEERVDFHSNLHLQHGEKIPSDGDGSSIKEDNRQSLISVSAINLEISEDIRVQKAVLPESFVGSKDKEGGSRGVVV